MIPGQVAGHEPLHESLVVEYPSVPPALRDEWHPPAWEISLAIILFGALLFVYALSSVVLYERNRRNRRRHTPLVKRLYDRGHVE